MNVLFYLCFPAVFAIFFNSLTVVEGRTFYQEFEKRFGPINYRNKIQNENREITIMMATSHYRDDLSQAGFLNTMANCPKTCRVVSYASSPHEMLTADALIFHIVFVDFDIRWFNWLSRRRRADQLFIFYSMEPPTVLSNLLPRGKHDYQFLNSRFNWTMTYRTDSDIYLPYSGIIGYESIPAQTSNSQKPQHVKMANKRHIAAVISNCGKWNYDRIAILQELASFGLEVDIFGKCGSRRCPGRAGEECYQFLQENYLFYASFENSICPDYVTEKFFNIFRYDMVPIVIGGANYSALAPPNSFINLQTFKSAPSFANFLINLAKDEDAYNGYFKWKQFYHFKQRDYSMFCAACIKVHEKRPNPYAGQYYSDFDGWWQLQCNAQENVYKGFR